MSVTGEKEETTTILPPYLNSDFIASALENKFAGKDLKSCSKNNDNNAAVVDSGCIQMQKCNFELVTLPGQNFCSDIYRARASFTLKNNKGVSEVQSGSDNSNSNGNSETKPEEISLIIKDLIMEVAENGTNEYEMYSKVLSEMTSILQQNDASKACADLKLGPDCLHIVRGEHETYVLEDLNALGYKSVDRFTGADLPHALLIMGKMAQFHAASMIYLKKFPDVINTFDSTHFSAEDFIFRTLLKSGREAAIKAASEWPDFEDITTKMSANIDDKFIHRLSRTGLPENSRACVINHGDLWINNILFSYDAEDKPQNIVLVDFQNCSIGSLGFDVNFLLYTSVQVDVLKSHRYELLRFYYAQLKATLQQCDSTFAIPSWQTVMEEIRNCEVIGYYAVISEMPFCCLSNDMSKDFCTDTFKDPKLMQQKFDVMYQNKRVLETLRWVLDHFNELNVL